jgi:hypothetical protein
VNELREKQIAAFFIMSWDVEQHPDHKKWRFSKRWRDLDDREYAIIKVNNRISDHHGYCSIISRNEHIWSNVPYRCLGKNPHKLYWTDIPGPTVIPCRPRSSPNYHPFYYTGTEYEERVGMDSWRDSTVSVISYADLMDGERYTIDTLGEGWHSDTDEAFDPEGEQSAQSETDEAVIPEREESASDPEDDPEGEQSAQSETDEAVIPEREESASDPEDEDFEEES